MIVIGSRGSDLALAQSRWVAGLLDASGVPSRIEVIRTQGDRQRHLPLDRLEGKGFFTKEIEEALLEKRVDLAVHSLKDLPTASPEGLVVAAIPPRADPRECLVIRPGAHEPAAPGLPLMRGASVGTSSLRRRSLLEEHRSDLEVRELRGNVPTRVRRLTEGRFDAILVARAGLIRLGLDPAGLVAVELDPARVVPAPGQGALALQVRLGDEALRRTVQPLDAPDDARRVAAERGLLARLEGGCHLPLGAHAFPSGGSTTMVAFLGATEAYGPARRTRVQGSDPDELAEAAFRRLTVDVEHD